MRAKKLRSYALTGLMVLGIATTARAQLTIPIITTAELNADTLTLLIHGTNFIPTPLPRVLLGTDTGGFEELLVTHATTGTIAAQLAFLTPGSYRLVVQFGSRGIPIASLDVTMGAVGPQGPQGTPGDPGPQGPPGPDHSGRIGELEARIDALAKRLAALEDLLQHFSRSDNDVIIEGANLHVRSGSGSTDGPVNGLGNLVVGYNELRGEGDDRSGSHNLVIGSRNNFSAYGGLVAGFQNAMAAAFASVLGGRNNSATAANATVGGGTNVNLTEADAWATRHFGDRADSTSISGAEFNFVATGAAKLKAGTSVELQSDGNTALKSSGNLVLVSAVATSVSAGTTAKMSGTTVEVTGTAITDIKGGLVKIN